MKKIKLIVVLFLILGLSVFVAACNGEENITENEDTSYTISNEDTSYTISFEVNGGSEVNSHIVKIGESISVSPQTTKADYIFQGWFENSNLSGSAVIFPYTPTETLMLYAKWNLSNDNTNPDDNPDNPDKPDEQKSNDITATFEGFTKISDSKYSISISNETESINLDNVIEVNIKSNWKLTTDIQGNNEIVNKIAILIAGNNTYYVLVIAEDNSVKTYTLQIRRKPIYLVTFETIGGNDIDSQNIEEDNFATIPKQPTRTGYDFINWDFDFDTTITDFITISALWQTIPYSITYHLNGGTNGNNPIAYTIETNVIALANPTTTVENIPFTGWFSESTFDNQITEIDLGSYGDINLYARWIDGGAGNENNPYIISSSYYLKQLATWVNNGDNFYNVSFALGNDIDLKGSEWMSIGFNSANYFAGNFDAKNFVVKNFKLTTDYTDKRHTGLFGCNWGLIKNLRVENVTIDIVFYPTGTCYGGGLVGENFGTVKDCSIIFSSGYILAQPYYTTGYPIIGGLVGYNSGMVNGCYVEGNVTSNNGRGGGLVGVNSSSGSILDSHVGGAVSGSYAGGLVGINDGIITNSYSLSNVYSSAYAGGLVGLANSGTITNCYATGKVSRNSTSDSIIYLGGLIGYNFGSINNCYAIGDVSNTTTLVSGSISAGGLVGSNRGSIADCYSIGDVSVLSSRSNQISVGGLVGENVTVFELHGIIANCYTGGSVSASAVYYSGSSAKFGGLVGDNNATIINSYRYEEQEFCMIIDSTEYTTPSNILGTICTLADLNSDTFYTDMLEWDVDIWEFTNLDFINGIVPILKIFI